MFLVLVAALAVVANPVPADGLRLAPIESGHRAPPSAPAPILPTPVGLGLGGTAAAAGVQLVRVRRREEDEPLFVFVPGHGGAPEDFDDLIGRMGIDAEQVAAFDYRWVWMDAEHREAARWAVTSEAAGALHAYLDALAETHDEIYLVGHSKGGAVITEMLSRWDRTPAIAVEEVGGAALLDSPISGGALGGLQRLGYLFGPVADNGKFTAQQCTWFRCVDLRDHLGDGGGVEVIAVRNPDALITNFLDIPEDMRVYDLDDGGPHPFAWPWNLGDAYARIGEAHGSVMHSDVVADCIMAEANEPGSCVWPDESQSWDPPPRRIGPGRRGGGTGAAKAM